MDEPIWAQLKTPNPDIEVQLGEIVFSNPARAVFRAEPRSAAQNSGAVDAHFFLEVGTDSRERVNRFLEAKYLDHPHVLRYRSAGTLRVGEHTFTYAITERADQWANYLLPQELALPFARQVLSALDYLHAMNLIYCALSAQAVVRIGTVWKLSDFSQLRVAGTDTSEDMLSLAATLDTPPPEAVEGLITPAWDIWSFGQTLRQLLPRYKAGGPDRFRAVLLACLNLKPSSRPSVQQIFKMLDQIQSNAPPDV